RAITRCDGASGRNPGKDRFWDHCHRLPDARTTASGLTHGAGARNPTQANGCKRLGLVARFCRFCGISPQLGPARMIALVMQRTDVMVAMPKATCPGCGRFLTAH